MFDEQPDDPHGECAAEIKRLKAALAASEQARIGNLTTQQRTRAAMHAALEAMQLAMTPLRNDHNTPRECERAALKLHGAILVLRGAL